MNYDELMGPHWRLNEEDGALEIELVGDKHRVMLVFSDVENYVIGVSVCGDRLMSTVDIPHDLLEAIRDAINRYLEYGDEKET